MFDARRRRLAWLFALVLLTGLALSCCASAAIASHACPGHDCCAICAALRPEGRLALAARLLSLALIPAALLAAAALRRPGLSPKTPISLRIRMND